MLSVDSCGFTSDCGNSETPGQECPADFECFRGCGKTPNCSKEAVDHAFPNVQFDIDSRRYRALDETPGVIEKHLVCTHMHANRRKPCKISKERRSKRVAGIVSVQVGAHQFDRLRMSEVRIGRGACFPTRSRQGQISHGREHNCSYGRHCA